MFVPGFGAYVRMQEHPATVGEDARVGLAGPVWGVTTAVLALAGAFAIHSRFLFAVAHMTAIINLFNLTPVWQLDGGRGFNAMSRSQRWLLLAISGAGSALSRERLFILIVLRGAYRAFQREVPPQADLPAFAEVTRLIA